MSIGRGRDGRMLGVIRRGLRVVPLLVIGAVLIGAAAASSAATNRPSSMVVTGQGWRITLSRVWATPKLHTIEGGSSYTTTASNDGTRTYLVVRVVFKNLRYPARKTKIDSRDMGLLAANGTSRQLVGIGEFSQEGYDSSGGCTLCSVTISVSKASMWEDFAFNVGKNEVNRPFTFRFLTLRLPVSNLAY